jgi:AcrR family transcriptional regulator
VHIADIAGISPGTLYQYFANKEAVYAAMEQRFVNDVLAMLGQLAPRMVQLDIRGAVKLLTRSFMELLLQNDQRYLEYLHQTASLDLHTDVQSIEAALMDITTQYVLHHPELARVSNRPSFNSFTIYGGVSVIFRFLLDPRPVISLEHLVEGLGNMAVGYIGVELGLLGGDRAAAQADCHAGVVST